MHRCKWSSKVQEPNIVIIISGNSSDTGPSGIIRSGPEDTRGVPHSGGRGAASAANRLRIRDPDDEFDTPLAEAYAVDSGSEEEEEQGNEELLNLLQEEEDEDSEFQDNFSEEVEHRIGDTSPLRLFTQIWDQPLLDMIREQTNFYAWKTIVPLSVSETGISAQSRLNDWVATSV
ncbi:unnamed protein product [Arctia plantaginis]|uniref:Uncharacterized protein n=1 Tax=Arctia plantaginis TaxID=874455 RepID=A0A8S1B5E2_ARCPL|nr:unnamed protein product [Arctia plantaginis]